ncbi:MAG: nuclease-related domain-containing protein [Wenzhouxiangella sp.]
MATTRYLREYPALIRHQAEMRLAARSRAVRLGLGGALAIAISVAGYLVTPPLGLMLAGISAMFLFFSSITGGSSVPSDVLTGIEGEVRCLRELQRLPEDFILFNQVQVPDPRLPNARRELDFVVIGPDGLTIIEVKNAGGMIYIDPDQRHWRVARRGCGSSPNWHSMDSPLRQVSAQVDALERWLLTHGIHVPVRPMICFARSDVILQNTDSTSVPVLVPEQLVDRIQSDSDLVWSDAQRDSVLRLLSGKSSPLADAA